MFKDDYNSDDEESDDEESEEDEIINTRQFLGRTTGMLINLPIHPERLDPSIIDTDDDLNLDISSDDEVDVIINNHDDDDNDDELNDTDSAS